MLDQSEQKIVDDVRAVGWHCLCIEADDSGPSFAYTIGLQITFRHPEVIIFGLPPQTAHGVLSSIVDLLKKGRAFTTACTAADVLEEYTVAFDVARPEQIDEYFGAGLWYRRYLRLQSLLHAVQCFWPDKSGKFPWQRECAKSVKSLQANLCSKNRDH
ncbi:MAG: DUF4262 domain-containing protein [Phycisphaerales bacterium]|nr:DUF4262 domain-containing protein [Planctomycetota bacterium]